MKRIDSIGGVLFAALCGLVCAVLIASCGCGPTKVEVEHKGGYEVKVHHDQQDINLHKGWRKDRDRRRSPNE